MIRQALARRWPGDGRAWGDQNVFGRDDEGQDDNGNDDEGHRPALHRPDLSMH